MASQLKIVIPTAGRPELLTRTLKSLATVRLPGIYDETIVVENGPKGDVEDVVQSFSTSLRFRYLYVEKPGKSNALNVVLERLEDECLIYLTDDDIRFSENALVPYAEAVSGCASGWFFGGEMDVDFEEPPPKWLIPYLPTDTRPFSKQDYDRGNPPMVFLGCNWAAFAGDVRKAGGFDSRFGPGGTSGAIGQESDMQQRLLQVGIEPRFLPDAKVWHYVPSQRCSPAYIAHRNYRFGILDAIWKKSRPTNRWGIPFWHWRRVLSAGCRYLATRVNPNIETRFNAKRALYYELGQARGAWTLAKQS